MWGGAAVSDEDRLDRAETGKVLRRSVEFVEPYRRWVWLAVVFVTLSTMCTVAGPLLVKFATDRGLLQRNAAALNAAGERPGALLR